MTQDTEEYNPYTLDNPAIKKAYDEGTLFDKKPWMWWLCWPFFVMRDLNFTIYAICVSVLWNPEAYYFEALFIIFSILTDFILSKFAFHKRMTNENIARNLIDNAPPLLECHFDCMLGRLVKWTPIIVFLLSSSIFFFHQYVSEDFYRLLYFNASLLYALVLLLPPLVDGKIPSTRFMRFLPGFDVQDSAQNRKLIYIYIPLFAILFYINFLNVRIIANKNVDIIAFIFLEKFIYLGIVMSYGNLFHIRRGIIGWYLEMKFSVTTTSETKEVC